MYMPLTIRKTTGAAALLLLFLLLGCTKGKNIPDVSHIEVEVEIQRFEQDLFALDTNRMQEELQRLSEKYPFTDFFINYVLGYQVVAEVDSISREEVVKGFITHPEVIALYDTVMQHYNDLSPIESELEEAFRLFKYYFPNLEPPLVYTMISEYNTALMLPPEEEAVMVSLDLFLGPDYPVYNYHPLNLPRYITRTLTREQMTARIVQAIADDLVGESRRGRLLDIMVNEGKKLYIMDKLLPRTPDSIKWGYTAEQTAWVKNNEYQMWVHFIEEDLLYSDDMNRLRKLVDHSPTSPGMPPESPGRTANWVGLQVVKAYMQRFPETTLPELIRLRDAQQLLDRSRYKPSN